MARPGYWNHNVHYQPVILRAVPPGCGAALEVGCGDGLLASRLAERCAEVTAIDRDPRMTALARSRAEAAGPGRMTVVEADYLAYPVADASFDCVICSEVIEQVYLYLDGEMDDATRAKVRVHLDECSPCLRQFGIEQDVKALVARCCGGDAAPAALKSQILARLQQARVELTSIEYRAE